MRGRGHLQRRGTRSWRFKYELPRENGERQTRYATVHGTRAQAEAAATKLIADVIGGTHVDASTLTVGAFIEKWLADYAADNVGNNTFTRYAGLLHKHVKPRVGNVMLQQLKPGQLTEIYSKMAKAGLAPRTRLHTHRVVFLMLRHALQWGLVARNVADQVDAPRAPDDEVTIPTADQVQIILGGISDELRPVIVTALGTGLRRGELCALRWSTVDLDRGSLRVAESLEQTKRGGLQFKPPKTKHGKRTLPLAPSTIAALRAHRLKQHQDRLALGLGKLPANALVFGQFDDSPLKPATLTQAWKRAMQRLKLQQLTLKSLRHAYASALIAGDLDVLTVSRRLGHGSPALTLRTYGHLFRVKDEKIAQAIEAAFHDQGA